MTALIARRPHPGILSARKPSDLRTEIARPAGITEDTAAKAAAVVRDRAGAQASRVLAMLGLEVPA